MGAFPYDNIKANMNCDVYRAKPAAYIIQVDVYSMIFRLP
jgi:hypothetical protein